MAYQIRTPRWLRGLSAKQRARPDKFTLNRNSPLFRGLVFAGLGGMQTKTKHYHDSSLYGNHGTLTNMDPATDWVWSPELGRLAVRSPNDLAKHVSVPSSMLGAMTGGTTVAVSLWIKPTALTNYYALFDGGAGSTTRQLSLFGKSTTAFYWAVGSAAGAEATGSQTVILNAWNHIALTWLAGTVRIYVNGTLSIENTGGDGAGFSAQEWRIFGNTTTGGIAYNGLVSDVLVSSRAASSAEIPALADPSNVMLEVGGVPLIESKRTYFPVAVAPQTKKLYWPRKSNRRNPILSMEEILYVASNLGRDSDAPDLWRGLVGAWPLQEPGGVTAFDVVARRDGTLTGGPTRVVGEKGRAVAFAGDDDYIHVAASPLNGQIQATLVFWGYRSNTSHVVVAGNPVGYTASFRRFNVLWSTDGKVYWQVEDGTNSYPNCVLSGTGLHFFCMVFDGSKAGVARITPYIDGTTRTLGAGGTNPAAIIATGQPFAIGREQTEASTYRYSTGQIWGVCAYDRCLTPAEIKQHYADPRAMYRLRKKVPHFFLHTGPRVVDAAFSNETPFDVSESIGTVTATDAIGTKTWEIVSQTQE